MMMTRHYPVHYGFQRRNNLPVNVIILEKVPKSLRGELSKWLIEPKAGVFVGKTSALVKDKLWEKCVNKSKKGAEFPVLRPIKIKGIL